MTTMLEKIARALAVEWYCEADHDDAVAVAAAETQWTAFESLARAALQAIRDVPISMLERASKQAYGSDPLPHEVMNFEGAYVATIDEILEESRNDTLVIQRHLRQADW